MPRISRPHWFRHKEVPTPTTSPPTPPPPDPDPDALEDRAIKLEGSAMLAEMRAFSQLLESIMVTIAAAKQNADALSAALEAYMAAEAAEAETPTVTKLTAADQALIDETDAAVVAATTRLNAGTTEEAADSTVAPPPAAPAFDGGVAPTI